MRYTPAAVALSMFLAVSSSAGLAAGDDPDPRAAALVSEGRALLAAGDSQGAIDLFEAALVMSGLVSKAKPETREPVIGGQQKAPLPHRFEIPQIGATATPPPLFDVIGKEPTEPKGIIAQMGPGQKAPRGVATLQVVGERGERVVGRVVVIGDLPRPLSQPEVKQD